MLRKTVALLCMLLLLISCRPVTLDDDEGKKFSILSYRGAPALSVLSLVNEGYDIQTSTSVDTFVHSFEDGKFDILIAPVNVGVDSYNSNQNYRMLAVIGFGNSYLVADKENYGSGNVGAYGPNTVGGKLINYLSDINLKNYNIVWYDSPSQLEKAMIDGEISAAIVDEITFNKLNDSQDKEFFKIEDLRADYEYETKYGRYPEFAIFVRNDLIEKNQNDIVALAKKIKSGINTYKTDKTTFNNVLENTDVTRLGFDDYTLIRESYNYCGLDYVNASSCYDEIAAILELCEVELSKAVIIE